VDEARDWGERHRGRTGDGTGAAEIGGRAAMSDRRWLALLVLCLGDLMIVLDVTIVGVALPSIRTDLGFSEESLAWVVNAYLITFGGFLLLGGRLGDLFGHRTLFLAGVALFTAASAACGLANSQEILVGARRRKLQVSHGPPSGAPLEVSRP
jgi:MFS family permease